MVSVRIEPSPCVFRSSVLRRATARRMKYIQLDWNHFLFYAKCMDTTNNENIIFHIAAIRQAESQTQTRPLSEPLGISFSIRCEQSQQQQQYRQHNVRASERTIDANFRISHFTSTTSEDFRIWSRPVVSVQSSDRAIVQRFHDFMCPRRTSNFGIKRNW